MRCSDQEERDMDEAAAARERDARAAASPATTAGETWAHLQEMRRQIARSRGQDVADAIDWARIYGSGT